METQSHHVIAVKKCVEGISHLNNIDLNMAVCFCAAGNTALSQRSEVRNWCVHY